MLAETRILVVKMRQQGFSRRSAIRAAKLILLSQMYEKLLLAASERRHRDIFRKRLDQIRSELVVTITTGRPESFAAA